MENSIVGFRCLPFADKNILEKVRKELTEHKSREMVLYRGPDDKTWCHALVHKAWYTEELAGSCTIRRKESQGSLMRLSMRSSAYNAYQRYLQKLLSPEPSKNTDFSFDSMFGEWDGTILVEDEEVYDDCGFSPAEQFLHEQTPAGIEKELNKFVLGQPELTRAVADFLYYHALRQTCPELPQRPLLIAGPSGSGKTEVWRTAKKLYGHVFPIQVIDGSNMTCDGWAGSNKISTHVTTDLAEGGILVVDEFDKMTRPKHNSKDENISMDIQGEFLKLVEGEYQIIHNKKPTGKTSAAMGFVLVGAFESLRGGEVEEVPRVRPIGFLAGNPVTRPTMKAELTDEDFVAYGIMPELVGRIAVKCSTRELPTEVAIAIVRNPHSRVSRIAKTLESRGMEVGTLMSDAELEALIRTSRKNRTGMRWASAQVESRLLEALRNKGLQTAERRR